MLPIGKLLARWNALPAAVRLAASGGIPALLTLAIVVAIVTHPARTPLFPVPLHAEQLTEVEERLAEWNVPFTPTSENVVVEAARRNDLLLRLSLAGIPHAHLASTGEALASIGVLTPQAVIDAQTRAGLAGDIEAGLRGIEGVDDARVIVAPAKAAEFADESAHSASASVRLRLRSGAELSREAIAGIRAFVAASVPELEPARVTILDDRGIALGDDSAGSDEAVDVQRSLQTALDSAFGEGATIVRARAEYDGSQYSAHDVQRNPLGAAAIERVIRNESYDSAGKRYRKLERVEDGGSETHELLSQTPRGALKRLTAAVFVDRNRSLDLAKVREFAAATIGYDESRGDTLAVEAVDFHRESAPRKDAWWLLYGTIVPLAPALVLAIGLVASAKLLAPPLASLMRALLERTSLERASKAATSFPPARVRSMLEQEPPHAAAAIISALPAATAAAVLDLYPAHEREAIVTRMQRSHSPLISDAGELLRRHV
jgi:flagellar biosynthesis/type III secretory pathway M-ring protein FliF/YscJ